MTDNAQQLHVTQSLFDVLVPSLQISSLQGHTQKLEMEKIHYIIVLAPALIENVWVTAWHDNISVLKRYSRSQNSRQGAKTKRLLQSPGCFSSTEQAGQDSC